MTDRVLDRRREVWVALSDLWLDTELEDRDLDRIADVVRRADITPRELHRIVRYELAPFLGWNHLSVAGEWAGFDPEWVCEEAAKRMGAPSLRTRVLVATGVMTFAVGRTYREVAQRAFARS